MKITLARTWWHGNSYHLRHAPESLQKQPSNLDWSRYLGPVKWRFHWARIGSGFYLASKASVLKDIAEAELARAEGREHRQLVD